MALVRWSPWQDLVEASREMDGLMRRFFHRPRLAPFAPFELSDAQSWVPAVDVFGRGDDLVVRAELPGVDPENDVDINVQDGVLRISGERRRQEQPEGDGTYRIESRYGAFERSIVLPDGVNADDISASYEDGILEVVVPQAAKLTGARRIPVQVGGGRKAITTSGQKN